MYEVAKRDLEDQEDEQFFDELEKKLNVELDEKPEGLLEKPVFGPRFKKFRWLAPIQVHTVCRICTGLCCRLKAMHVALTFIERQKLLSGKLNWKVEFSVPYPNANRKYERGELQLIKKLDDVPEGEIRKATDEEIAEIEKADPPGPVLPDRRFRRFMRIGGIKGHPQEHQSDYHQVVWYLAKKPNGECLYRNSRTGRCAIYANRPHACKAWFCRTGTEDWQRTFEKLVDYAKEEGVPVPREQIHRGIGVFVQQSEQEALQNTPLARSARSEISE